MRHFHRASHIVPTILTATVLNLPLKTLLLFFCSAATMGLFIEGAQLSFLPVSWRTLNSSVLLTCFAKLANKGGGYQIREDFQQPSLFWRMSSWWVKKNRTFFTPNEVTWWYEPKHGRNHTVNCALGPSLCIPLDCGTILTVYSKLQWLSSEGHKCKTYFLEHKIKQNKILEKYLARITKKIM